MLLTSRTVETGETATPYGSKKKTTHYSLNKWLSSDYGTVGCRLQLPLTLSNLFFPSGAVNESVPDAAAHPNREPSQEENISPQVRKLATPKLTTEIRFVVYLHK